ncbi:endonuclease/exonuclease/phosphatase family protein [Aquincola sp. J276]|uniref:endonuclease/exonuclease/phosphatase family protein n=1 Tax=Aquincola sp. J276 TaxID=2898432 RepID=UPI002151C9AD|nr:endonuclease/exonuclease/phosphatase family protein [Aquincola sp. J276]MCR5867828.1 endonuclease/exonuclease/phosphatase family protein [Aquincola sp. J276]
METGLLIVGGVLALATALALWRRQSWWVRIFDFPRLQIAGGLLLVLLGHLAVAGMSGWDMAFRALLLGCLALQVWRILPYTRLARVEVLQSEQRQPREPLRLMFANVLQPQHRSEKLLELIREADPDVVLALETDDWWAQQLAPLAERYPHDVLLPQDNTYGMLLYSRLPLHDVEVSYLIEPDIPSIHCTLELPTGLRVRLHCLHPRPPAPAEHPDSVPRDAELLVVGKAIKGDPMPTVVMGDLNDVAWSHTSSLFRRISGLLDPRRGRGFYNTFHAAHWLVRYPLDHFFHSNDFKLVEFRRLPAFGSDHFPVYIHLSHEPQAQAEQPEAHADGKDQQEAREKIDEAV